MICFVAQDWQETWTKIHALFAQTPDQIIDQRFATRAMCFNNLITVKNNNLGQLDMSLVGYGAYKNKMFDSRYIISGKKEEILATLLDRAKTHKKLTVISYPFRSDNSIHSQGPCIVNMYITMIYDRTGWRLQFDINMRIAEVTRRFLVDCIKFSELIQYFIDGLSEYNMQLEDIKIHSKVMYSEFISLTIAEHIFAGQFSYDKDHWLHKGVQLKLKQFAIGKSNFHRGDHIREHVIKLKENNHDKQNTR